MKTLKQGMRIAWTMATLCCPVMWGYYLTRQPAHDYSKDWRR